MIHTFSKNNMNALFHNVLEGVFLHGSKVTVRGCETREIHPCLVELTNPLNRTLIYPRRGNNPFQSLAETMWVIAGRNDMEYLTKFLPRAADFADNGTEWRAGYGPRLRAWSTFDDVSAQYKNIDQFEFILKMLRKDPASRQAIMTIWNPGEECKVQSTKDYPCSNWIHFMIRENKLDCTVAMRSNDVIWGWSSINVYEFTVIQELLAACLGIEVGSYFHLSDSMHIYEKDYSKMSEKKTQELLSVYQYRQEINDLPVFKFTEQDVTLEDFTNDTKNMCLEICDGTHFLYKYNSFDCICALLNMYNLEVNRDFSGKGKPWRLFDKIIGSMPFCDLKVSIFYWYKKNILKEVDTGYELIAKCISEAR